MSGIAGGISWLDDDGEWRPQPERVHGRVSRPSARAVVVSVIVGVALGVVGSSVVGAIVDEPTTYTLVGTVTLRSDDGLSKLDACQGTASDGGTNARREVVVRDGAGALLGRAALELVDDGYGECVLAFRITDVELVSGGRR